MASTNERLEMTRRERACSSPAWIAATSARSSDGLSRAPQTGRTIEPLPGGVAGHLSKPVMWCPVLLTGVGVAPAYAPSATLERGRFSGFAETSGVPSGGG